MTIFKRGNSLDEKMLELRLKVQSRGYGANPELGSMRLNVAKYCEVAQQNIQHPVEVALGEFKAILHVQASLTLTITLEN